MPVALPSRLPGERGRPLQWTALRWVTAFAVSVPILALAAIGIVNWNEAWREAERELTRSADAATEYVSRVLDGQRLAADRVNDLLQGVANHQMQELERPLHLQLAALLPELPMVGTISIVDTSGRLLLSANMYPAQRDDLSDREWVRDLKAVDTARIHISKIEVGRYDGKLSFGVSRRRMIAGQSGYGSDYSGVISIAVDPNKLAAGFSDLVSRPGDEVRLVRADGEILAQLPGLVEPPGPATPAFFSASNAGPARGTYLSPSRSAAKQQLIAFRRIPEFPAFAVVSRDRGAIARRWWNEFSAHLGFGIPAIALVIGMAMFASRRAEEADKALASARFHAVFDASPIGMAIVEADTRRLTAVNGTLTRLAGITEDDLMTSGVGLRLLFAAGSIGRIESEIEQAGRKGSSGPIELDVLNAERRRLPVRISISPLPGSPPRVVMTIEDITEQRETEARRQLMMREVEHRAKNTLAVVQAAVRMGASGTTDARELARAVEARVAALGRSQSLLTTVGAEGAELRRLIEQEVGPFAAETRADGGRQLVLEGPDVRLSASAAQALTMTFHELATNAAKYGAFSIAGGVARIAWRIDSARDRLVLDWRESNGPPIEEGRQRLGFGTRLVKTTIEHQLGGKVAWRWEPTGVRIEAEIPPNHVLSAEQAAETGAAKRA